ncbi:MAG: sensor histidine kinase [Spirochaetales bacterium]|jgi:signal transduction histidine kinase|nr:sensor histidine kinase [Spirochaetales bacterium]
MDGETPTKQSRRFYRILEAYAYLLLCAALGLFVLTYGVEGGTSSRPFEFYRTFFVFFLLFALMQALLTHTENLLGVLLLCFLSLMALLVLDYSLNDFLTIRLFLFLAFQAVVLVKIPHPFAFAAPPFLALFSLSLQLMPPFLGENDLNMQLREAGAAELVSFLAILLIASYFQVALTRLHELHEKAKMQIEILNTTITKLTIFSQSLQSYARTAELEAAKKERYRISREIHDISGYMFTNIIAMMDAIVATGCRDCEKTSEMCSGARSQAQEGLVETRRALHLLRKSDQEREVGMKAIHKIKKIFEGTTGVQVEIESGNLPSSFGDEIDLILYRIVQEGLTNALRHGHATRVRMLFWIVDDSVQVIILDNGTGAKKIIKGIGLAGMEERISKLGGQVKAENAPEGGFQLTVTIPMQKELSDDTYSVG